ncbi:MAG: aminotransferase class III-fold pyridoxal phosphate-dependent enzyme [Spirochaetes bacterium]|nr:aminotransferase class III-fold pyridoxal phosphate-dependent enzyme [Spirochaetota bacterium]
MSFYDDYIAKTPTSEKEARRAQAIIPGGVGSATDLAEEIQRRYPVIEMLRFTQSGVEATMYAVRLARAATKKYGVLKVEGAYHGANDILLVSAGVPSTVPAGPDWMPSSIVESEGIQPGTTEHTHVVQFNHIESLEYQLKKHEGEIACFILEPCMTNGGGYSS